MTRPTPEQRDAIITEAVELMRNGWQLREAHELAFEDHGFPDATEEDFRNLWRVT